MTVTAVILSLAPILWDRNWIRCYEADRRSHCGRKDYVNHPCLDSCAGVFRADDGAGAASRHFDKNERTHLTKGSKYEARQHYWVHKDSAAWMPWGAAVTASYHPTVSEITTCVRIE
jgi:hypothetical protein